MSFEVLPVQTIEIPCSHHLVVNREKRRALKRILLILLILHPVSELTQSMADCPADQFAYDETLSDGTSWLDRVQDRINLLNQYIQNADPILQPVLTQKRIDLVNRFINGMPSGTCIQRIDLNANSSQYPDVAASLNPNNPTTFPPALNGDWLFITHTTFGYPTFLTIWDDVIDLVDQTPYHDDRTFVVVDSFIEEESGEEILGISLDLTWPKFRDGWNVRGPAYWSADGNGDHWAYFPSTPEGSTATVIGGTFGVCHKATMYDLVEAVDPFNPNFYVTNPIELLLPMKAIALSNLDNVLGIYTDYLSLQDYYDLVNRDTWDFLDYYDFKMVPPDGDPAIFAGEQAYQDYHVATQINGVTVDRRGGPAEPTQVDRIITVNMTTQDGQEPALPDLNIKDVHIFNFQTVFFTVFNSGTLRFREPVDVFYQIIPDGEEGDPWARGVIPDFVGGVDDFVKIEWECPHDGPWPPLLRVELSVEGRFIESNTLNNSETITTSW